MNNYLLSIKIIVLLVMSSQCRSIFARANLCSCYTFHTSKKDWKSNDNYCQQNGGNLVTMETEEEYQLINKTIQSRNDGDNEWHIGLSNKTGEWKWVSNYRLTIDKWQPNEPSNDGPCVVMAKAWPKGHYGLFNDLRCDIHKMFICEYKTEGCNGTYINKWCSANTDSQVTSTSTSTTETGTTRHRSQTPSTTTLSETSPKQKPFTTATANPMPTSTPARSSLPTSLNTPSIQAGHVSYLPSTTDPGILTSTAHPTRPIGEKDDSPNTGQRKKETKPFSMIIVVIALGVVLLLSVCFLTFACYWKRRNRDSKCEMKNQETNEMLTEVEHSPTTDQGPENGDPTEEVQLFHQKNGESYVTYAVIHNNLTQQNQASATSIETATYASIVEAKIRSSSKKNDPNTPMPVAGSTAKGRKDNTEVVYASVDKRKSKIGTQGTNKDTKANNTKKKTQDDKPWYEGQQVVYTSVDKSRKSKAGTDDVLYAEVENKVNTDKQQPSQITYADLADFNHSAPEAAAVKPVPYQPVEYAVIIGQKKIS